MDGHPKLTRLWLASQEATPENLGLRRVELNELPLLESVHLPIQLESLTLERLPSLSTLPSAWEENDILNMQDRFDKFRSIGRMLSQFGPIWQALDAQQLSLRSLPSLTKLNLNKRQIESLDVDVASLTHLSTDIGHHWQFRSAVGTKYEIDNHFCELIARNRALETLHLTNASLTHRGWAKLASLEQLKVVDLNGSNISDADLGAFANASELETLKLSETQISDDGWAKLPRFPELQRLSLSNTEITSLSLQALPKLADLGIEGTPLVSLSLVDLPMLTRGVTLAGSGPMTIELSNLPTFESFSAEHQCIDHMILRDLPALNHLDLTGSTVNDSMLSNVGQFVSLKSLLVGESEITDATLRRMGELPNLDRLIISGTPITNDGLASLSDKLPLTILGLAGTNVTDAGLRYLPRHRHLRELSLGRTKVRGPGLRHLSALGALRSLSLEETQVTSDSLQYLLGSKQLSSLRLSETQVDDSCFSYLNQLPLLRSLFLDRTLITDQGVADFTIPRRFKTLDVSESQVSAHWVGSKSESRRDVKIFW